MCILMRQCDILNEAENGKEIIRSFAMFSQTVVVRNSRWWQQFKTSTNIRKSAFTKTSQLKQWPPCGHRTSPFIWTLQLLIWSFHPKLQHKKCDPHIVFPFPFLLIHSYNSFGRSVAIRRGGQLANLRLILFLNWEGARKGVRGNRRGRSMHETHHQIHFTNYNEWWG